MVKLKPMIFLPGDFICRKDDIGREMYIVQVIIIINANVIFPADHDICEDDFHDDDSFAGRLT